jgi:hypothetical protein
METSVSENTRIAVNHARISHQNFALKKLNNLKELTLMQNL